MQLNGGGTTTGYGWNIGRATSYTDGMGYYQGDGQNCRSLGEVTMPAETFLLGDISNYSGNIRYLLWSSGSNTFQSNAHNGGGNYAFVDGHAKFMSRESVFGQPRLYIYNK